VYPEEVTAPLVPAARSALDVTERVETVPPPFAAVATRKKLLKAAPVEPVPLFVIVEVNACGTHMLAVLGVGAEGVRFGIIHPATRPASVIVHRSEDII